jgi:hypothetical protein
MTLPLYLSYMLKMLLISAVLLGYYRLFLRNTGQHTFNRYYLLASVVLALQAPLWSLPLPLWTDPVTQATRALVYPHYPATRAEAMANVSTYRSDFRLTLLHHAQYLYILYGLITLAFLWPLLRSLYLLHRLKQNYPPTKVAEICVYSTREPGTPFSFFRHLFWNEDIATDTPKGQLIFRHELYHIRHLHSLDLLLLETARRLFWCNPFFYFTLRELKLVHEFLADRYALESPPAAATTAPDTAATPETITDPASTQRAAYAEWLVWQTQGLQEDAPRLVHSFYHTQLKRRIAMILNPAPPRAGYATRWLCLPLALVLLFAFAARTSGLHPKARLPFDNDPILQNDQLTRYYMHHLLYPQVALEQGMEGKVWFEVDMGPDGYITSATYGTQELDTQGGKVPTITVTSRALNPHQRIFEPAVDSLKSILERAVMEVSSQTYEDPVTGCPPGIYYFSVVFKIEKPTNIQ